MVLGFCMVFLGLQWAKAQPDTNTKKSGSFHQMVLHLDKPFYVTGEYIWFKVYLPIEYKGQEVALRVSLYDVGLQVHEQFFIPTNGRTSVFGYFKIPFDWKTGTYQLSVSGLNSVTKENVRLILYFNLLIFNDLNVEEKNTVVAPITSYRYQFPITRLQTQNPYSPKFPLQIQLKDNSIRTQEQVSATIEVKDRDGNPVKASLSVAVRDWSLTADSTQTPSISMLGQTLDSLPLPLSNKIHLWYKSEKSLKSNLIGVFSHDDHQFLYPSKDTSRHLLLEMPFFEGEKNLQFVSLIPEDLKINLYEPSIMKYDGQNEIFQNNVVSHYIQQSRLRKKIYQLYSTTEFQLDFPTLNSNTQAMPISNKTIQLADYEYFSTLPIFLKEVSSALKYRKEKKDQYVFKMFNPATGKRVFYNRLPLFVVDGQITRNSDFIADLDVAELESLDLFFVEEDLKQYFGAIGSSGVVYLTTKSKELKVPTDDREDIFTVHGTQVLPTFPILQKLGENESGEIPRFGPLVYWHPDLKTDSSGKCSFSFRHGHDKGRFVIEVVAQTVEGEIWKEQVFYEVE